MSKSFKDFNLSDEILKSLNLLGYEKPTEVQSQAMTDILNGKDLIVKSQTGSGKTAAFALPILQLLSRKWFCVFRWGVKQLVWY